MNATLQDTTARIDTSIGELIALFYEQFLASYGDPELASVATAALINDMLAGEERPEAGQSAA